MSSPKGPDSLQLLAVETDDRGRFPTGVKLALTIAFAEGEAFNFPGLISLELVVPGNWLCQVETVIPLSSWVRIAWVTSCGTSQHRSSSDL